MKNEVMNLKKNNEEYMGDGRKKGKEKSNYIIISKIKKINNLSFNCL